MPLNARKRPPTLPLIRADMPGGLRMFLGIEVHDKERARSSAETYRLLNDRRHGASCAEIAEELNALEQVPHLTLFGLQVSPRNLRHPWLARNALHHANARRLKLPNLVWVIGE